LVVEGVNATPLDTLGAVTVAPLEVSLPAEALTPELVIEVAVATPRIGVMKVGEVE
jgi:hypothetical protein